MPLQTLSHIGLKQIDFTLEYYADLFHFLGVSQNGNTVIFGTPIRNGRIESLPVTITSDDILLDNTVPLISLRYQAMLTDSTSTTVAIKNLRLNSNDAIFNNCHSPSSTSNATVNVLLGCGDSLLRNYLGSHHELRIISLAPNPATGVIFVNVETPESQTVQFEIVNTLGVVISSKSQLLNPGTTSITLITQDLPSGLYFVRVRGLYETIYATFQRQ